MGVEGGGGRWEVNEDWPDEGGSCSACSTAVEACKWKAQTKRNFYHEWLAAVRDCDFKFGDCLRICEK